MTPKTQRYFRAALATLLCMAAGSARAEDRIVSCEEVRGRLLVPVLVDGSGPYPFLLDTCLRMPIIERDLAAKLYTGDLPVNGTVIHLGQLQFGGFNADALDAILAGLGELSARLGRELGGILPAHQPGFEVTLDFAAKQARWRPMEKGILQTAQRGTVAMTLDAAGAPVVETALGGGFMRRLRVDSAGGGGLALTARTLEETGIALSDTPAIAVPLSDGVVLRQCRVSSVRVADTPLDRLLCMVLDNTDSDRLGVDLLRRFRVTLNYEAGLARFETQTKGGEPAAGPLVTYGLVLQFLRGGLWEIAVAENSPAFQAGLRTGDALLEINGASVADARAEAIEEMLRPDTGYSVTLTCQRGDARISAAVSPAPMI